MTDYRLWPATNGPDTSGSDGVSVTLATEWYVTAPAWLVGTEFYRGTVDVEPTNLRTYRVDSESAGTVVAEAVPVFSGLGWQATMLDSAVELVPFQRYRSALFYPDHITLTGAYWSSGDGAAGITNGILVAPNSDNATGGDQGSFLYDGAPGFPVNSANSGCYWISPIVTDVPPVMRVVLGLAVETHSAQALAAARRVQLAQAQEIATGHTLAAAHRVPLELAAELDTAHAPSLRRGVPLGLAVETDTALPVQVAGSLLVPGRHTTTSSVAGLSATSTVSTRLEAT